MRDRFGATDPRSLQLRTHTQTAGSTLTLQQPENNIVRAAVQALAAALGGVQSMALSCFDEAIAIPTQQAPRRWRCAPSRCCRTSSASPRWPIRWAGRGSSSS